MRQQTVGPFHSSQFLSLVFIPLWQDLIKTTGGKKVLFLDIMWYPKKIFGCLHNEWCTRKGCCTLLNFFKILVNLLPSCFSSWFRFNITWIIINDIQKLKIKGKKNHDFSLIRGLESWAIKLILQYILEHCGWVGAFAGGWPISAVLSNWLCLLFGQIHNNCLRFYQCKIPLDGSNWFWYINHWTGVIILTGGGPPGQMVTDAMTVGDTRTVVCIKVGTASFPRFWKNHP